MFILAAQVEVENYTGECDISGEHGAGGLLTPCGMSTARSRDLNTRISLRWWENKAFMAAGKLLVSWCATELTGWRVLASPDVAENRNIELQITEIGNLQSIGSSKRRA